MAFVLYAFVCYTKSGSYWMRTRWSIKTLPNTANRKSKQIYFKRFDFFVSFGFASNVTSVQQLIVCICTGVRAHYRCLLLFLGRAYLVVRAKASRSRENHTESYRFVSLPQYFVFFHNRRFCHCLCFSPLIITKSNINKRLFKC